MTRIETNKFRKVLEATVIDLSFSTRRRDAILVEKSAEELESTLQASEREIAIRKLEAECAQLREAREALRRIREGAYGTCVDCEEDISPRRLAALPAAALCIRCQESLDCRCAAKKARPVLAMAA